MTNGTDESSSMMNNGVMQDIGNLANSVGGDSSSSYGKACAGCGGRILDRFLLHAMERYWHTGCLKCSCCQTNLEQLGSCFTRSGMILCKNDYLRMFGSGGLCSGCGQTIPPSELVMRAQANVYHVNCFKCVTCHSALAPGDRFCVINGGIFCEQDYPKMLKGHMQNGSPRGSHKVREMIPMSN